MAQTRSHRVRASHAHASSVPRTSSDACASVGFYDCRVRPALLRLTRQTSMLQTLITTPRVTVRKGFRERARMTSYATA